MDSSRCFIQNIIQNLTLHTHTHTHIDKTNVVQEAVCLDFHFLLLIDDISVLTPDSFMDERNPLFALFVLQGNPFLVSLPFRTEIIASFCIIQSMKLVSFKKKMFAIPFPFLQLSYILDTKITVIVQTY